MFDREARVFFSFWPGSGLTLIWESSRGHHLRALSTKSQGIFTPEASVTRPDNPTRPQRSHTKEGKVHTHTHIQPVPPVDPSKCAQHCATACTTCKRLRRTADACCKLGHHADDHVARRPQLQLCPQHGLPPCPRCTLKQRGVCHCCQRGHHKVCTPVPVRRKRPLTTKSQLLNKRPCLQGPVRISSGLLRSPHQPPTPPAPKRRRPKTPLPHSPHQPLFHRGWRRQWSRMSPARFS